MSSQKDLLYKNLKNVIKFWVVEEGEELDLGFLKDKTDKMIINQAIQQHEPLILTNEHLGISYDNEDENKEENEDENSSTDSKNLYIFYYQKIVDTFESFSQNIYRKLEDIIKEDQQNQKYKEYWEKSEIKVKIFVLVDSLKEALTTEKKLLDTVPRNQNLMYGIKNKLNELIEEKQKNYVLKNIDIFVDFLEKEQTNNDFNINVISRTFATTAKPLHNPSTKGYVFTAKLFDIVELYNIKGKSLFDKNIRVGIEDVLNVDSAINETLENSPSDFWYLNNGITILAEEGSLGLYKNDLITLKDISENKIGLTVINGAQTINSAARFFYRNAEGEILKKAKDNAYVMLKIIEINPSGESNESNMDDRINQITISLNRQKPVTIDDMAYTLPVIKNINNLNYEFASEKSNETEEILFSIVRRGEIASIDKQRYTLKILPRVLMTIIANKPGSARTAGIKTLLKIDEKKNEFSNKEIFPSIESESLESSLEKFKEIYAAVNFSMKTYDLLELEADKFVIPTFDDSDSKEISEKNKSIIIVNKYGKYLLLYTIVLALKSIKSGKDKFEDLLRTDYKKWDLGAKDVKKYLNSSSYKDIVTILSEKWMDIIPGLINNSDKNFLDSNAFKRDDFVKLVAEKSLPEVIELFNNL